MKNRFFFRFWVCYIVGFLFVGVNGAHFVRRNSDIWVTGYNYVWSVTFVCVWRRSTVSLWVGWLKLCWTCNSIENIYLIVVCGLLSYLYVLFLDVLLTFLERTCVLYLTLSRVSLRCILTYIRILYIHAHVIHVLLFTCYLITRCLNYT